MLNLYSRMWDKITVGKYQELYEIITDPGYEHEIDRDIQLLCCMFDKPTEHYENMLFTDLQQEVKKLSFLHTQEPPAANPSRYFTVKGKTFRVIYDFRDLAAGQFIDVMSSAKEPQEFIINLHRLLAAICRGTKRTWRGRRMLEYGAVPFDQVAEAMKHLPIMQANATAVFFYQLWTAFLKSIPDYLESQSNQIATERRQLWTQVLVLAGVG